MTRAQTKERFMYSQLPNPNQWQVSWLSSAEVFVFVDCGGYGEYV